MDFIEYANLEYANLVAKFPITLSLGEPQKLKNKICTFSRLRFDTVYFVYLQNSKIKLGVRANFFFDKFHECFLDKT